MRHHALQRLLVRMQYDPVFAASILAEAARPALPAELVRLGLGERERGWLRAMDVRAFHHDPLKRRRALRGLMEEFKAASAIVLAETRRIAFLDGFFTSRAFHEAIQERGSLATAYARFLGEAGLKTPQLPGVVAIELALASSRRALEAAGGVDWKAPPVPPRGLTHVARAPGVAVGRHSPDALLAIQTVEKYLFEIGLVPALALVEDAPRLELPPPSPVGSAALPLGFVPTQSGISLVELEEPLFRAIAAVNGRAVPVGRIGAALAAELVEDEVLVAVAPS